MTTLQDDKEKLEEEIDRIKLLIDDGDQDEDLTIELDYLQEQLNEVQSQLDAIEQAEYEAEMRELNDYYWSTRF